MKKLALLLALIIPVASCATLVDLLPTVLAGVQDGSLLLDAIHGFVDQAFVAKPDAATQKKLNLAIARARTALDLALRIATGTKDLDQAKVDAAFAEFRSAYSDVISLARALGVEVGDVPRAERFAAAGGDRLLVPSPLALTLKVAK